MTTMEFVRRYCTTPEARRDFLSISEWKHRNEAAEIERLRAWLQVIADAVYDTPEAETLKELALEGLCYVNAPRKHSTKRGR